MSQEIKFNPVARFRALYVCERSLQEHAMLVHSPSKIAAAAVMVALKARSPNQEEWAGTLEKCTGYTPAELLPCATEL